MSLVLPSNFTSGLTSGYFTILAVITRTNGTVTRYATRTVTVDGNSYNGRIRKNLLPSLETRGNIYYLSLSKIALVNNGTWLSNWGTNSRNVGGTIQVYLMAGDQNALSSCFNMGTYRITNFEATKTDLIFEIVPYERVNLDKILNIVKSYFGTTIYVPIHYGKNSANSVTTMFMDAGRGFRIPAFTRDYSFLYYAAHELNKGEVIRCDETGNPTYYPVDGGYIALPRNKWYIQIDRAEKDDTYDENGYRRYWIERGNSTWKLATGVYTKRAKTIYGTHYAQNLLPNINDGDTSTCIEVEKINGTYYDLDLRDFGFENLVEERNNVIRAKIVFHWTNVSATSLNITVFNSSGIIYSNSYTTGGLVEINLATTDPDYFNSLRVVFGVSYALGNAYAKLNECYAQIFVDGVDRATDFLIPEITSGRTYGQSWWSSRRTQTNTILNPGDMIEDLLRQIGETSIATAYFDAIYTNEFSGAIPQLSILGDKKIGDIISTLVDEWNLLLYKQVGYWRLKKYPIYTKKVGSSYVTIPVADYIDKPRYSIRDNEVYNQFILKYFDGYKQIEVTPSDISQMESRYIDYVNSKDDLSAILTDSQNVFGVSKVIIEAKTIFQKEWAQKYLERLIIQKSHKPFEVKLYLNKNHFDIEVGDIISPTDSDRPANYPSKYVVESVYYGTDKIEVIAVGYTVEFLESTSVQPNSIDDLVLWLDANDGETVIVDEYSKVSEWRDKSGNNFHLAQSNGNYQPEYFESGIGGKPGVRGDGQDDYLTRTSCLVRGAQPRTVFVVASSEVSANTKPLISDGNYTSSVGTPWRLYMGGSSYPWQESGYNQRRRWLDTIVSNTNYLIAVKQTGTNPTTLIARRNGTQLAVYDTLNNRINAGADGEVFCLFTSYNLIGSTYCFQGSISEVLVYKRALTDAEILKVENYLKNKWGIS
ncbi:MAG: hypothetical protein AMQ22_00233 [Candidatus Methanofastidiosum methylothiophilum]|uniref:Uncharacterized protein n=1 Tax=Candidatus Methanofastidiosum methylothiophilum TaxID=1705564 RepID=A0A150J8J1_9EURY|nr:MAG: hypothetical protein AMQ22_00233 [Candidatus Methanofastidiosum methylthiophilus]